MRPEISPEQPPGINLDQIIRTEVEVINIRRGRLGRPALTVHETGPGSRVLDAVGLALSGGGIRSAAFSLGVLQSLNEQDVLQRVDYLSTVSGGGYMGASLTATMTKTQGGFVFGKSTGVRAAGAEATQPAADVKDSGSVGHIRNYSNYLIPRGARDLVTALAIIVRGLVANVALVLPIVLLLAAITILGNPNRSDLTGRIGPDFLSFSLDWLPVKYFGITLLISLIGLVLFFAWGMYRSLLPAAKQSEFRTWLPTIGASYLIIVAASFFCELQPFVISGMFSLADASRSSGQGDHSVLTASIQWLATIATPVAAAVAFFRQQLGTLLKSVDTSSHLSTKIMAVAVKGAIWIAGAALPLLIWIAFIYLCYWGIINDGNGNGPGDHTPKWLIRTAELVSSSLRAWGDWLPDIIVFRPVTLLYVVVGILLFGLSYMLRPNANSLHQLYRDRLSKAFLFDPTELARTRFGGGKQRMDQGRDFAPLDTMRISELVSPLPYAPYHLINAALNVQGSDYANRRGRNADFFLFSPCYVGSEATGYRETLPVEAATNLDLATAMAVSGAAFSPNMGASSIRPLTPTLAILNVRTGYWLKNPRCIASSTDAPRGSRRAPERTTKWYLWSEITGRLYEDSDYVYITDGGHIENLGIYELLRRRCRVIVAVDAEADPTMRLPSFIALQRYARLDLGVRINMPWDEICKSTRAWMGFDPSSTNAMPPTRSPGPHSAIGTIDYDGGEKGWLLYIKTSLTGDENDYVRDYARRYEQFPHETTGDQFFSEEQFEVYRALGFHITNRLLNGDDTLQVIGAAADMQTHFRVPHPDIDSVRNALM